MDGISNCASFARSGATLKSMQLRASTRTLHSMQHRSHALRLHATFEFVLGGSSVPKRSG